MMEAPNVFLLTVDSLRYDYFSEVQAEIADMVDGVEFTNAVSTATQTSSSMPTLATGAYTDEFETWGIPGFGEPRPLSEVVQEYGYSTALWTDNYLFGAEYNYDRGFDGGDLGEPTTKKRLSNAIRDGPASPLFPLAEWAYFNVYKRIAHSLGSDENFYRSAETLNEAAHEWRTNQSRPLFAWIHYMDPHHPFEPPAEYLDDHEFNDARSRSELGQLSRDVIKANGDGYSAQEIADVRTAYEATCEYIGDRLVEFVETLIADGAFEPGRDVLVVTADHGECLSPGRYRSMGHVPPALWEESVRVPLVVAAPDWDRDVIREQTSLADLYGTLRELLEARLEGANSQDSPQPEAMTTDIAHFVTEWEVPNEDTIRVYRGIRTSTGTKLFGGHIDDEDVVVLTRYDEDDMSDDVLFETDPSGSPTDDDVASLWTELRATAEERGPLVGDRTTMGGEINEDHLRNLGYME